MSEDINIDLEHIGIEELNYVPAEYKDQTGPPPLAPGNYKFLVVKAARATDKDGNLQDDNGYPQLQLTQLRVVEPEAFAGRDIYPFQKVSLKPIQGGERAGAVPAVDLLRGFDDQIVPKTNTELLQTLLEKFEAGSTFYARTNWTAKDSTFIKDTIEAAGGDLNSLDEAARKDLFKKAIVRGQKNFPKLPGGGYAQEMTGPSGETITARVTISQFYPSSKEVKKLGPSAK